MTANNSSYNNDDDNDNNNDNYSYDDNKYDDDTFGDTSNDNNNNDDDSSDYNNDDDDATSDTSVDNDMRNEDNNEQCLGKTKLVATKKVHDLFCLFLTSNDIMTEATTLLCSMQQSLIYIFNFRIISSTRNLIENTLLHHCEGKLKSIVEMRKKT